MPFNHVIRPFSTLFKPFFEFSCYWDSQYVESEKSKKIFMDSEENREIVNYLKREIKNLNLAIIRARAKDQFGKINYYEGIRGELIAGLSRIG